MIILGHLYSSTPSRRLRGVICREIEMRLAGRAETRSWFTHTVKSHRQLAAGAAHHPASDTDLSQELLQIQNLMAAITHSPAPSPNSSLLLTMLDAVQQLQVNDFWPGIAQEDIGPNLRKTGRIGGKEKREVQKDLLVRWPLFVAGWINIHDWKHKDSLQSPWGIWMPFFQRGENNYLFEWTCSLCLRVRVRVQVWMENTAKSLQITSKTVDFHIKSWRRSFNTNPLYCKLTHSVAVLNLRRLFWHWQTLIHSDCSVSSSY